MPLQCQDIIVEAKRSRTGRRRMGRRLMGRHRTRQSRTTLIRVARQFNRHHRPRTPLPLPLPLPLLCRPRIRTAAERLPAESLPVERLLVERLLVGSLLVGSLPAEIPTVASPLPRRLLRYSQWPKPRPARVNTLAVCLTNDSSRHVNADECNSRWRCCSEPKRHQRRRCGMW